MIEITRNSQVSLVMMKQLGDLILTEPLVYKLWLLTGKKVAMVCRPQFSPLIQLIDHAIYIDELNQKSDVLISLDHGSKSSWKSMLTPSKRRELVLFTNYYDRWAHRLVYDQIHYSPQKDEYRSIHYWKRWPLKNVDETFRGPQLIKPPMDWCSEHVNGGSKYILVHMTSAWKRKCWNQKSWEEALIQILEYYPGQLVLTSGPVDWEVDYVEAVRRNLGERVICLAGKTSLQEYLYLISRAVCVLSIDGSSAHAASAFCIPNLTLFGPTNFHHWSYPTDTARILYPKGVGNQSTDIHSVTPRQFSDAAIALLKSRNI